MKINKSKEVRVLFVCMGNICRSPTAHGVFESLVKAEGFEHCIDVDSAGTHAYHIGEPPDRRAQLTARERGIDLSTQRARQAVARDFEAFHYILAMDRDNFQVLSEICPPGHESKLHLFMDFAEGVDTREVPDPYYGGEQGFERVFDMVDEAARGLLESIRRAHPSILCRLAR